MIRDDIPWEDYKQLRVMNPSTLVNGIKSMLHLKRAIESGTHIESDAMRLGTGIHALLLEPDEFESRFVVMPQFHLDSGNMRAAKSKAETEADRRTDSKATAYYKAKVAEFASVHAGKTILTREQYRDAFSAIDAMRSRPAIVEILESSRKEVTVFGEIEGIAFKGRVDLLSDTVLCDLKTTNDVSMRSFGRTFAGLQYDFKLAIYRELVRQNVGDRQVKVIAQETSGDFDTVLVNVPLPILEMAWAKVLHVVQQYKRCLDSNRWPGVDGGEDELELVVPQWAMEDFDDLDFGTSTYKPSDEELEDAAF